MCDKRYPSGSATDDAGRTFAEDFRLENEDTGAALPGAGQQTGFDTGVIEKGVTVPAVLGGDLRQQQAAVEALLHDQPMTPNLNGVDRLELTLRSEHGNLERDIGHPLGLERT